jgi:hypothetical protein
MKVHWSQLGDKLAKAGGMAEHDVLLIAPFAKVGALSRVIAGVPKSVPIRCVSRWRIEEIAAGVSDLNCFKLLEERPGSSFLLCPNLHTKYFRFDSHAFLGSANLTQAALGWSERPNAEALVEFESSKQESTESFENSILSNSIAVDAALHAEFESMLYEYTLEQLPTKIFSNIDEPLVQNSPIINFFWSPKCRSPEYLFRAYLGDSHAMSSEGSRAAVEDLHYLDLPIGLSETSFNRSIRSRMMLLPVTRDLDIFLSQPRRFGEMRLWTQENLEVDNGTDSWQTLMRWLLHFLPDRYQSKTANYSEIFSKRCSD